ncbi:uncharacterized protein RHOBADRAFT_51051 [Rhodotorula graminis WP1]|uniref:Proteophosphoglycan ppg4 n=1 Tax=Rhodotorula graminis (strain WP1) TaxID=578459 RepID=A0A194SCZ0_RHOGW|nr:uncharacterized protein RHOBADRAFT_51051 [Rhodotorula graminis WP1]KPV78603.1 hypothetical protein RHOBADRAFT_51051 [Rhodotorula graminis WP1]
MSSSLRFSGGSSSSTTRSSLDFDDCVPTFDDQLAAAHTSLDTLATRIRTLRALSARLAALHPNDLSTPTLALDLRDALLDAAARLRDVDREILRLWEDEERVWLAGKSDALGDYLEVGAHEFPHLLTKDVVHASRFVVDNPFSILLRLLDGLEALKIPQLVKANASPATLLPPPSPPPLYRLDPSPSTSSSSRRRDIFLPTTALPHDPTPAGASSSTSRRADWKQAILADAVRRTASGKETRSHRFFDEIALDLREGAREMRVATGRGHRERWIIFTFIALFPVLLLANLLEDFLSSRRSASTSSSGSTASSFSLRTLAPTMLNEGAVSTGVPVSPSDPFADPRSTYGYDTDLLHAQPRGPSAGAGSSAGATAAAGAGAGTATSAAGTATGSGPRSAPLLSRTSVGRSTSGKSAVTPWYLKWSGILALVTTLLLALGLGVGLGVGLGTRNQGDGGKQNAAQANAASTVTSMSTLSSIVTADPTSTSYIPIRVTTGSASRATVVQTLGGSTVTVAAPATGPSRAVVTVSQAVAPSTRTEVVDVTTFTSTQTVTTTLEGAQAATTITQVVTVRRTVTAQAGGFARRASFGFGREEER